MAIIKTLISIEGSPEDRGIAGYACAQVFSVRVNVEWVPRLPNKVVPVYPVFISAVINPFCRLVPRLIGIQPAR